MMEIKSMDFDVAMSELEEIVNKLEDAEIPVEKATKLYERGAKLKEHCQKILDEERTKIHKIATENGIDLKEIEKEIDEEE